MMLLDTSGLFCYHHRDEPQHSDAVMLFHAAPTLLTHNYVLAEFVSLCQAHGLNRADTLAFVADLMDNEGVEIVWVDESLHRAALAFLQARLDKTYSLCDAVSFVLMRIRGITEALTTDHHFEQGGRAAAEAITEPDRRALDEKVFNVLGLTEEERLATYCAVTELVKFHLVKAKSVGKEGKK